MFMALESAIHSYRSSKMTETSDESFTTPPPPYSCCPAQGEKIIDHSLRLGSQTPNGTFIKHQGNITVVLSGQEDGRSSPLYRRGETIEGSMLLERLDGVCKVKIKIEGRLDLMGSSSGARSLTMIDNSTTLWKRDPSDGPICPSSLAFSLSLPRSFKEKSQIPGLLVTSVYTLIISVTSIRHTRLLLPDKVETLRILITYFPRTRPERPTLSIPLFSSIKSSPEEWTQSFITVRTKGTATTSPVQCNLFVPSVQTFAITDTIPCHVQLSGSITSLEQILDARLCHISEHSVINLSIRRQISVERHGTRSYQTMIIGEGDIRSVPQYTRDLYRPFSDAVSREEHLDWEGELKCTSRVTVGGFSAAGASVKDFIVVIVKPPSASPFLSSECYVPILLVTDTWENVPNGA
ncbi:uncharacterized protein EV420DRAFT_1630181 [Desarmillaria tabescens]|uniref:Uncharacterized protein n=1 Tax=Armillaria tabescens TaxID=1929756 RepID=A0AA39K607_ARMTA|nr:uncharacterized protein EV420DRAFT_1630181 [Desarmillaria tabescens]KAK0455204.1 hypothetical protein EV420DRAFT_1630181 [Desarmillaria tabescens]